MPVFTLPSIWPFVCLLAACSARYIVLHFLFISYWLLLSFCCMLSLQVSASQLVLCLANQVCIQLHPLAVNMALPALYQSCPPPYCCNSTDGRTPNSCIDPALHTAWAVPKMSAHKHGCLLHELHASQWAGNVLDVSPLSLVRLRAVANSPLIKTMSSDCIDDPQLTYRPLSLFNSMCLHRSTSFLSRFSRKIFTISTAICNKHAYWQKGMITSYGQDVVVYRYEKTLL